MNNEIQLFQFKEKHQVRVSLDEDGNPWWVAADVCNILGLGNPRTSIALLDDDEKDVHSMDTPGGPQEMAIINEPGLYSLIFRSRKEEAKAFKRWVTHEVLPCIRKNGFYASGLSEGDYFTVRGYDRRYRRMLSPRLIRRLEKSCMQWSELRGYEVKTVSHASFGTALAFHVDVLHEMWRWEAGGTPW